MDKADSTFAGVKVYMRIIISSIIYDDTLAAKQTDFVYDRVTANVVFSFLVTLLAKSDTPDSHTKVLSTILL